MRTPTLGVCLCTYNGERYLREQLASIARQSRKPDVAVIVDDASADGTAAISREFQRAAPFPVHFAINRVNLGYAKNFGLAIERCEADILVLSDQDDEWREDRLARIEAAFTRSPAATMVFSDAEVVGAALAPLGYRLWELLGLRAAERDRVCRGEVFPLLVRQYLVTGATMAFRAALKPLVLPMAERVYHDGWIALLAAAVGDVAAIDEPLIRYRQHGGNQIGARRLGPIERIRRSHLRRFEDAKQMRMQHEQALARLESTGWPVPPDRIALLREAIDHLRIREALPKRRIRRLAPIAAELSRGRYGWMARGASTALTDLLL